MDISTIVSQVRLCIDEEGLNDDYASQSMDNIIKGKITDALRWCIIHGEGSMLGSSDSTDGYIKQVKITVGDEPTFEPTVSGLTYADGVITLPLDVLKAVRIKNYGQDETHEGMWYKSVMNTIDEDSEPYLMLSDDTSTATIERPVVALIESCPQRLELYPKPVSGDVVEMTYVINPKLATSATAVAIPTKIEGAFIYYLAFLVMSAYGDSRAQTMLGIARMELGVQETNG